MQKIENVMCPECGERKATISACDGCGIAALKCECGHTLKLDETPYQPWNPYVLPYYPWLNPPYTIT